MTYFETWHIQNPGISSNLAYSESWHIQNPGAFRILVYKEPWYVYNQSHIEAPGIFRISSILTTLPNLCDRALYENNSSLHYFLNISNFNLSQTGRNKVELALNILAYSNIINHIQEWSRDIQTHSEPCVTLVYSESWYIQNQSHLQNTGIFTTWSMFTTLSSICDKVFYENNTNYFLLYFQIWQVATLVIPVVIRWN